jgi:hypothetical protein
MINKEVVPAFDMLLEELERIIPDLNDQAKALMDQKNYDQAHALLNKAQSVVAFQGKVVALREEWVRMQVPPTKPPEPVLSPTPPKAKKVSRRTDLGRLESGLRTKNTEFHMPILKVLVNSGGRMQFQALLSALEVIMKDTLNEYDWQVMNDKKSIRWQNNVGWTKKRLSDAGHISATAPKGIWLVTPAGRKALEDYEERQASGLPFN